MSESGQTGRPCQPAPAVELGEDAPPGVEPRPHGSIVVTNVDRAHHGLRRSGRLIGVGRAEIDETQPLAPIPSRTPLLRPAAEIAVAVDPDFERGWLLARQAHQGVQRSRGGWYSKVVADLDKKQESTKIAMWLINRQPRIQPVNPLMSAALAPRVEETHA